MLYLIFFLVTFCVSCVVGLATMTIALKKKLDCVLFGKNCEVVMFPNFMPAKAKRVASR